MKKQRLYLKVEHKGDNQEVSVLTEEGVDLFKGKLESINLQADPYSLDTADIRLLGQLAPTRSTT